MCELHLAIPDVPIAECVPVLRRLGRIVDPVRAARAYERVAGRAEGNVAVRLRAEARQLRSRLN
jgi:hypothetical protein